MHATIHRKPLKAEPAWQLAERFPVQGHWTEGDYLALDASIENQRTIELVDGRLEFLPMPTIAHEKIVRHLFKALDKFNDEHETGEVFFSGVKSRLREGEIRLPDIFFIFSAAKNRHTEDYYHGADLVMEVVSKSSDDRYRDWVEKRKEYAKAGIQEYWIIDPKLQQIVVFTLNGKTYRKYGEFGKGERADSVLLKGFEVDVSRALAGMKP
jgi:Uma2 family endonuclease